MGGYGWGKEYYKELENKGVMDCQDIQLGFNLYIQVETQVAKKAMFTNMTLEELAAHYGRNFINSSYNCSQCSICIYNRNNNLRNNCSWMFAMAKIESWPYFSCNVGLSDIIDMLEKWIDIGGLQCQDGYVST